MCRSDLAQNPAGHRKPAPFLAVSGTRFLPDTMPDTGKRALARVSVKVSGCPAEIIGSSRMRTHARAPARTHEHTHISNGHPDTFNTGAAFRCPVPKFEADTSGHLEGEPDTMTEATRNKPMRAAMPTVAAFIDAMRVAFGAETIDRAMRDGMAGLPTFYAAEGGKTIGTPATMPDPARCVSVGVVQLAKGSRPCA